MKQLSIEQKAQRFDEAIKKAKKWYNANTNEGYRGIFKEIFPELKESEDEKIRKAIIQFFELQDDNTTYSLIPKKDIIAWLEKQGEQKPTDKVEPKFKVGDWVIDKQGIVHQINNVIENVTYHTYGYEIVGGGYFNDNTEGVRLWTIQDAKDGDVLASKDKLDVLIFRNLDTSVNFSYYYNIVGKGELGWSNECFIPATKEQRDLLFQKMKEAGYEWDAEKKELKKIEQKPAEWSEEDEKFLDGIIANLEYLMDRANTDTLKQSLQKRIDWLKSLKERYTWKPSIAQLNALSIVSKGNAPDDTEAIVSLYNDLKKLTE